MVIKFDLSSEIPPNAEIIKSVLSLFFTQGTIGDKYSTAYRLTKVWDESSVSWMNAGTAVLWAMPGGDYSEEKVSRTDYVPDSSWEHYEVTGIVRQFTSGTANYGFIIESDPANGNKRRCYCSSEFMVLDSLRPKLTIVYTSNAINTPIQYKEISESILLRSHGSVIKLYIPFEKHFRLSLFNAKGKILETVYGCKGGWYQLKAVIPSNGVYLIQINKDGKTISRKLTLIN